MNGHHTHGNGGMTDFSHMGGGEGSQAKDSIKKDLEGWREVLIPLSSFLKWDKPYYPAVMIGLVTFLFSIIWYFDMSTLTTVSLLGMLVGIIDFAVPYFGPNITGLTTWTVKEEVQFSEICDKISSVREDIIDIFYGLSYMRQQNAKLFFTITMATLAVFAWVGSLMDNLLLAYIIVSVSLLLPGLRHVGVADRVLGPVMGLLSKVKGRVTKVKAA